MNYLAFATPQQYRYRTYYTHSSSCSKAFFTGLSVNPVSPSDTGKPPPEIQATTICKLEHVLRHKFYNRITDRMILTASMHEPRTDWNKNARFQPLHEDGRAPYQASRSLGYSNRT